VPPLVAYLGATLWQGSGVRLVAVGLAALVPVPLATGAVAAPGGVSGLRGLVMQGPTRPVCVVDEPCEEPAAGILLQFKRDSKLVAEVKTTRAGRYSVTLRAGSYVVQVRRRPVGAGLSPRVVRVPRGRIARVDFHLDTGIQ
jgi:hypothetical protein